MGLAVATSIGLVVWIVLWAIGWHSFDAFMISTLIITLAATAKILAPSLRSRE